MTGDSVLSGLLNGEWKHLTFEPFREGVEVHYLRTDDPVWALLRYCPGARVPRHRHTGLETIFVLEGVQSDDEGDYAAGTMILNPAGTEHSVWSDAGCVVLIQWERPVLILE